MGCRKNPNKNGRVDSWQVHQCCWPWVTPDVLLLLKLANNSLVNNSELYTLYKSWVFYVLSVSRRRLNPDLLHCKKVSWRDPDAAGCWYDPFDGLACWGSTTMLPPSQSGWTVAAAGSWGGSLPVNLALEAVKRLSLKDLAASGLGGDTCNKLQLLFYLEEDKFMARCWHWTRESCVRQKDHFPRIQTKPTIIIPSLGQSFFIFFLFLL